MSKITALLAASALAGLTLPVHAQQQPAEDDDLGFKVSAGIGWQWIDNLFATSTNPVADTITTETLGLGFKKAYGTQQFSLGASAANNTYANNSSFNYVGSTLSAGWNWNSGTRWSGAASATQSISQAPYGFSVNSTQQNLTTKRENQANVGYDFGAGWQGIVGVVNSSTSFTQSVIGQSSYQYSGLYGGSVYTFRSGNTLTLNLQQANGSNQFDYQARSAEARIDIKDDEGPTYAAQLMYWTQEYSSQPQYNFGGFQGYARGNWPLTDKTAIAVGYQRALYANPSTTSIYSTLDSISIAPTWQMTPKVGLRGQFQDSVLQEQGNPGGGTSGLVSIIQSSSLGLYWNPYDKFGVVLSTALTSWNSNSGNNFTLRIVSLVGTYAF